MLYGMGFGTLPLAAGFAASTSWHQSALLIAAGKRPPRDSCCSPAVMCQLSSAGHRSTKRESLSLKKGMLHYIYDRKLMTQVRPSVMYTWLLSAAMAQHASLCMVTFVCCQSFSCWRHSVRSCLYFLFCLCGSCIRRFLVISACVSSTILLLSHTCKPSLKGYFADHHHSKQGGSHL